MHFDSSLITWIDSAGKDVDAIETELAEKLYQAGYVKDTYSEAVRTREQSFPTALNCEALNAAIPHCDIEHVVAPAMCVAILSEPVSWCCMDDPSKTCPVQLVVMLALDEAHGQLESLQKVVGILQHQDDMETIVHSTDKEEVTQLLLDYLA